MQSENIERIKYLVDLLNRASRAYYAQDREIMSNFKGRFTKVLALLVITSPISPFPLVTAFTSSPLVSAEGADFHNSRKAQFDFLQEQGFQVVEHYLVGEENILETLEGFEGKIGSYDIPSDRSREILRNLGYNHVGLVDGDPVPQPQTQSPENADIVDGRRRISWRRWRVLRGKSAHTTFPPTVWC